MTAEWSNIARLVVSLLFPAVAGLVGVWIGAKLSDRREAEKRRYDFIERQLAEFYALLLGIRMELKARNDIRNRISALSGKAWKELVEQRRDLPISMMQEFVDKRGPEFSAIIEHDNKQVSEAMLPAYRKMVEIFRERLWLAEADTRLAFFDLIEFVDIWERFIARSLPYDVLVALEHSETKLETFYDNLQLTHDRLRVELAGTT